MQLEFLALRLIHVLSGVFWVGTMLFTTFFLLPALAPLGPTAGQVMANLTKRRMFVIVPTVAVLSMLSGLRLLMITSSGFSRDYFALISGKVYALAALSAIVAFLLGMIVARPAALRVGALAQQAASASPADKERIATEMKAMQSRAAAASLGVIILLLLAASGMAVARYL